MQRISILVLCLAALAGGQTPAPDLHGTVTDPSGAVVPGAMVQLRGPGGEQRKLTDVSGQYSFPAVRSGKYLVRVIAKGFTVWQRQDFEITAPTKLDAELFIQAETQVLNVEDEANKVTADPADNGGAIVLKEKAARGSLRRPRRALAAVAGHGRTRAPDRTAARSTSTVSPAATCRPNRRFARSASTPIRSRPNTSGPGSGASRSSPSRAPTQIRGQVLRAVQQGGAQFAQPAAGAIPSARPTSRISSVST